MIVLYNPLSTTPGKQPLPLSVMALAAVLEDREPWMLVDGNVVRDPAAAIIGALSAMPRAGIPLLAVTVMPGPQLTQAVAVCRAVRLALPHVPIVWGGYFPTQHTATVLASPFVDYVVRSQGEQPLLQLVDALKSGGGLDRVGSLSWQSGDTVVHNPTQPPVDLDDLPDLPYARVDMGQYIQPTYLGRRTVAHNSSFGCPFACSFCAVVAMSNRRWLAQTPARMERVIAGLVATYGVDAVQMHDMDFFISEARVEEFAARIAPFRISWWGLGRIDTLMQYSDRTWRQIAQSGLKMVFSGAESASDSALAAMNKGGKSAAHLALDLARRMREYCVVPECRSSSARRTSPSDRVRFRPGDQAGESSHRDCPTPTRPLPMETTFSPSRRLGFAFPTTRRMGIRQVAAAHDATRRRWPWLDDAVRQRIRNFERAERLLPDGDRSPAHARAAPLFTGRQRLALSPEGLSAPYELRALHRVQYQRPETTGF